MLIFERPIDGLGFALENYDVIGGWREHYRSLTNNGERDSQGRRVRPGPPVDPSDVLTDGRRFRDIDDAIRISNGTAYGLSSAVCTNRLDYITRFVNELHVGTVNVREVPGYRLELTPFGGIKDSGLGYKEGVQEAIKSFTNLKTYSLPWGM